MPQFPFDTDHLTFYQLGHLAVRHRLASLSPGDVGISAVTMEEALRGRLAGLSKARDGVTRVRHYAYLVETIYLVNFFPIIQYDQTSEDQFQQIIHLRTRLGTQDLKIAAVA